MYDGNTETEPTAYDMAYGGLKVKRNTIVHENHDPVARMAAFKTFVKRDVKCAADFLADMKGSEGSLDVDKGTRSLCYSARLIKGLGLESHLPSLRPTQF